MEGGVDINIEKKTDSVTGLNVTDQSPKQNKISEAADSLLRTNFRLTEMLGERWIEKCISSDINQVLTTEEITMMNNAQEVLPGQANTPEEKFIVDLNGICERNQKMYKSYLLTREDNTQMIMVMGHIGNDTVYQLVSASTFTFNGKHAKSASWSPYKMGFIDSKGKVFSIDNLLDTKDSTDYFLIFAEADKLLSVKNSQKSYKSGTLDTMTVMPTCYDEVGILMHEIGHLVRQRFLKGELEFKEAQNKGFKNFNEINRTGTSYQPNATLDNYHTRAVVAQEERGASATGLDILRVVGHYMDLDCASKQAMIRMKDRLDEALATYDEVPYSFDKQPNNKPVPTFSKAQRKAARQLHNAINTGTADYSKLHNFDPITGESLANNPDKVLKIMGQEDKTNP